MRRPREVPGDHVLDLCDRRLPRVNVVSDDPPAPHDDDPIDHLESFAWRRAPDKAT
jgi:hypothetical protein